MSWRMPRVGEIVHYVLEAGPSQGACRVATVTGIVDEYTVDLEVRIDDRLDQYATYRMEGMETIPRRAIHNIEGGELGTWHWPSIRAA